MISLHSQHLAQINLGNIFGAMKVAVNTSFLGNFTDVRFLGFHTKKRTRKLNLKTKVVLYFQNFIFDKFC